MGIKKIKIKTKTKTKIKIKIKIKIKAKSKIKIKIQNKNKKRNSSSVAKRAEPAGDILWLLSFLQDRPGGHHLSTSKALTESLQGSSTNLDSHSVRHPLPFPTGVSCPPPGVHTVTWVHLGDRRAATALSPAGMWRGEGKEWAQHHSGCTEHTHHAPTRPPHLLQLELCCMGHHHTFLKLLPALPAGFPASGGSSKHLCTLQSLLSCESESTVISLWLL